MDQATKDILRKIKACLARADETSNDNEHERAVALRQANGLMDKHNITALDLQQDEMGPRGRSELEVGQEKWRSLVLSSLAKMYGCRVYIVPDGYYAKGYVIGRQLMRDVVIEMSEYVRQSIEREVNKAGKGRGKAYRNSFKLGASDGVAETVAQIMLDRAKAEQAAPSNSKALVLTDHYKNELIANSQWLKDQGLVLGRAKAANWSDHAGLADGRRYGKTISLNDQLK